MIPPSILLFLILVCPESPRFLIRRRRYAEAYKSLRHLRGTDIQAARDLYYIHIQLQAETQIFKGPMEQDWYEPLLYQRWIEDMGFFKRIYYLFSKSRSRRACVAAFIVMAAQQLCGVSINPSILMATQERRYVSLESVIDSQARSTCLHFTPP